LTSRRVIVNADDLGWSAGVTDGILLAHRDGIVTSATLAANMPDAERAASLAGAEPSLGVGIHLNVCQGRPLSGAGARLAGHDGLMRMTGPRLIARCLCWPWLVGAALAECDAQIRWALERGVRPTHLDSHRHVHAFPPLFVGVARLARRYGIPFVRWPREALPGGGWPRPPRGQARAARLLRIMCAADALAGRARRPTKGTWGIAHTGHVTEAWLMHAAQAAPEGITEIMTHPGFSRDLDCRDTRLIDSRQAELDALCSPRVREAFAKRQVEMVHYGQLCA
jgi:chitin disaccharide deacetylase